MLRYLSVKDQSVTGMVTTSPVSHRPARRSLGSSPTTRSTMSATSSTATIAPTTITSFLMRAPLGRRLYHARGHRPLLHSALASTRGAPRLELRPSPRRGRGIQSHPKARGRERELVGLDAKRREG